MVCSAPVCRSVCRLGTSIQTVGKNLDCFVAGQEICIDADESVLQVWALRHQAKIVYAPVPPTQMWNPMQQIGICGLVQDLSILNAIRMQTNVILTMSPPCQAWSHAGKKAGPSDPNGFAFIDALHFAFAAQPILVAAECADAIMRHPHFPLVKAYAQVLGFKLLWMQVTPYHLISGHLRTRWLAVWARADVAATAFAFQVQPSVFPKPVWSQQGNDLRIPDVWLSQLILCPTECAFYNDATLLPKSKKAKLNEARSTDERAGLRTRLADTSEPLPTLCASYSRQHELSLSHVQEKGIFAVLTMKGDQFSFLPPGLFVVLFGTVEHLVLPTKIPESFHFLGNAISVPQSLLALSVGLASLLQCPIDPLKLVRQAWSQRLTAHNSVAFAQEDFVHFTHNTALHEWIQVKEMHTASERPVHRCTGQIGFSCSKPLDWSASLSNISCRST